MSTKTGRRVPADRAGTHPTPGQLAALPLVWLIRAYQLLVSSTTGASCRFYPSCSAYAVTALRRFGLFGGSWLALRRLLRCHPWNPGGVDHVPQVRSGAFEHNH